jgi:hypothetical protein
VGGWSTPRPGRFTPPGKETRCSLYRRQGGPKGRSGWVRNISTPTGTRSPDRPAPSQSLYRLRYPGSRMYVTNVTSREPDTSHSCHTVRVSFHIEPYKPRYKVCSFFRKQPHKGWSHLISKTLGHSLPNSDQNTFLDLSRQGALGQACALLPHLRSSGILRDVGWWFVLGLFDP